MNIMSLSLTIVAMMQQHVFELSPRTSSIVPPLTYRHQKANSLTSMVTLKRESGHLGGGVLKMRVICHVAAKPSIMKGTTVSPCSSGKIRRTSGHKSTQCYFCSKSWSFIHDLERFSCTRKKMSYLPDARRMDLNPLPAEGCEW